MLAIHEKDVPGVSLPGRVLHWVVSREQGLPSDGCTFCVMYVQPKQTVSPAHSHPDCEELIYVVSGSGHVYVDGEIVAVREGSAVLFSKDSVHMVRNSGDTEMKVACFFSEATNLTLYEFHPNVLFDEGVYR